MTAPTGARASLIGARLILAELSRDPAMLGLEILLPVFFLFLTVVGYPRDPRPPTWSVRAETGELEGWPGLESAMLGSRHADGRPSFELLPLDAAAEPAQAGTAPDRAGSADLVIRRGEDGSLVLEGDAMSSDYVAAANRVEELLDGLDPGLAGGLRILRADPPFRSPASDFEAFVPGMIVFAILLLIPQTAFVIGRESRRGTLDRLSGAGMGAASYLGGVALSQAAFAVLQGAILVGISYAVGYPFGPAPAAAAAGTLAILVLLGLGSVAQGLVIGAFARSDSSAINLGSVVAMLEVFLSGSFFAMPAPIVASFGHPGQSSFFAIRAYDLIPATHAVGALRRVLLDGGAGIAGPLAAMAGLSLLFFAAATVFFRKRFMRAR